MQLITFDPALIGTGGRIFPPTIESVDSIGYHGTSSYYSSDIDKNGFLLTKPLPPADLKRLVSIADKYREDGGDVRDFINLKSISFTPVSELALFYVRPESFGGQGLLHVTRLIEQLFQRYADQLTADETAHLTAMRGCMELIRQAQPVIYGVDIKLLQRKNFGRVTLAYHVYEAIPTSALVAKMVIDQPVDYATIDEKEHKQALRTSLYSAGHHYFKEIAS